MLAAHSPVTPAGDALRPKTAGRTPLQPKNTPPVNNVQSNLKPKPKPKPERFVAPVSPISYANKENNPDFTSPSPEIEIAIDASLAEELDAVRKRLERLRLDKEKTERMLRERARIFEIQMEELKERGEFQKELEIEVDRLYRLKQLQIQCMRMTPIRSLREREMQKRSTESPLQRSQVSSSQSSVRRSTLLASSSSESTNGV